VEISYARKCEWVFFYEHNVYYNSSNGVDCIPATECCSGSLTMSVEDVRSYVLLLLQLDTVISKTIGYSVTVVFSVSS